MNNSERITRSITGGRCNDFVYYARPLLYRFRALTDAGREYIGGREFWDVTPEVFDRVKARMIERGMTVA